MGRSCALVSCSCAVSWVTGSLGKSLPLLLCPLVDHSLNYPWPKLFPAAIVKCIQLKPVNSLGVKTNCSFWQTISLLPRISWLCVEWHRSLRARRLFPAAGVGFIGRKPPTFVGKEMHELCRQDCTTSPWDSCRYPGLRSSGPCPIHTTSSDLFVSGNDRQKMQNWSGLKKALLNQLKVYI